MATSGITSPTFDPITTAKSLATKVTAGVQDALTAQIAAASADATALGTLRSAMSAFQAALSAMGTAKSVLSQAATFSSTAYGTATASASAAPGTYVFSVEKLATAAQVSYDNLADSSAADAGSMKVNIGASSFTVDLGAADKNGNGTLTPQEIATAINTNADNAGRVTAAIITINGSARLVLSSNQTGAANIITIDASNVDGGNPADPPSALRAALDARTEVVVPQDATIYLGGSGGTAITQASNTFTNIDGVSMTFSQVTAPGATVTLTVATDTTATTANVQKFVDAYNTLKTALDKLTDAGDPDAGVAASIYAHDSGLVALKNNLTNALRQSVGGVSLAQFGIIASRAGVLTLDAAKLTEKMAADPSALDTLIGNNSLSAPSGIAGALDKYLDTWTSSTGGQISRRLEANDRLSDTQTRRQERITQQYDTNYNRYLAQYTALQVLQEQMAKTLDMFDALFSSDS